MPHRANSSSFTLVFVLSFIFSLKRARGKDVESSHSDLVQQCSHVPLYLTFSQSLSSDVVATYLHNTFIRFSIIWARSFQMMHVVEHLTSSWMTPSRVQFCYLIDHPVNICLAYRCEVFIFLLQLKRLFCFTIAFVFIHNTSIESISDRQMIVV